jgi:hypothetical protein
MTVSDGNPTHAQPGDDSDAGAWLLLARGNPLQITHGVVRSAPGHQMKQEVNKIRVCIADNASERRMKNCLPPVACRLPHLSPPPRSCNFDH